MPVNKEFLKDLITKHNDQNDLTRIIRLVSNSQSIYPVSDFYNPENLSFQPIEIADEDMVWRKQSEIAHHDRENEVITFRTGLDNVESVMYFEPGNELDRKTGKRIRND